MSTAVRAHHRYLALAIAVLTLSACGSNQGKVGAADGLPILHVYSPTWKGEICVIDGDGTGRRCLTDNRRFDYEPVWSPDGSRIAFTQQTDDPRNPDVYTMNADGTEKKRLTFGPRDDDEPQWSPDGTQILWNRNRGDNPTGKLMVMNADGTEKHPLAGPERDDADGSWSPTGDQIAFISRDPCASPDCPNFHYQLDIHVIGSDGSDERTVTQTDFDEVGAVWSPDGSRLAFVRDRVDGAHIFVVNADGTGEEQLTDGQTYDVAPDWSPDGGAIAFTRITDPDNFETRLAVVEVDTQELRLLTDEDIGGVEPTWSADGNHIAFTGHRPFGRRSSYEIHTIRPDGSSLQRLTRNEADESQLRWRY